MNSIETDIRFFTFPLLQHLNSVLQMLPTSALIADLKGNILFINQQAIHFLGGLSPHKSFENKNINLFVIDNRQSIDLFDELRSKKEILSRKILLRKQDNSIACVNLFARLINIEPSYVLIQFTDISPKTLVLLTEVFQTLRQEVLSLKPYLNNPGKELLKEILSNNSFDGFIDNKSKQKNQLEVIGEERISNIVRLFPQLTYAETKFCSFLSLKLTIDEIACITGKTSNALRVSFHRILRKTEYLTGKELLRKLESIR